MQRNLLITQSYPELPWAVLENEDAPALCHHFLGFVFDTKEQFSPLFPWYLVRIMTLLFLPLMKFPETVWTLQLEKHIAEENSLSLGLCEERTQSNDQYSNKSLLTFAQGKVHLFIYFAWCFSDFFFQGQKVFSFWAAGLLLPPPFLSLETLDPLNGAHGFHFNRCISNSFRI